MVQDNSALHPCSQRQEEKGKEMAHPLLLKDTPQKLSTSLSKIFHWLEFCYMATIWLQKKPGNLS